MIYCVEDDAGIRELVVYTLRNTGFEADGFEDGAALATALKKCKPQLILLDIMLPGEDGITILRRLRAAPDTAKIPVILLTAKNTVLRRTEDMQDKDESRPLVAGGICVDERAHTVFVNEQEVQLTLKEYQLLCLLMKNRGAVLTRDVLLENIWGYNNESETRTVDVHIRTLRQKLGADGALIETVRGVGYRMGEHT